MAIPPFTLKFKNEHIIYENIIKCTVNSNDFNFSYNPSMLDSSGSVKYDTLPYATSIGLYNQQNDLIMVGKFGNPIPMTDISDLTFLIKFDS